MRQCLIILMFSGSLHASSADYQQPRIKTCVTNNHQSPRIINVKAYYDDVLSNFESYEAAKELIEEVLAEATETLLLLDEGGFKLNLATVETFSTSPFYFEIGSTYTDRSDGNKTKTLGKLDRMGHCFAFQEQVNKFYKESGERNEDVLRYMFLKRENWDAELGACSEENCLCRPNGFPCIGVFPFPAEDGLLLAHEIGHSLSPMGDHIPEDGYIMSQHVSSDATWSEKTKGVIARNDLSCLKRI